MQETSWGQKLQDGVKGRREIKVNEDELKKHQEKTTTTEM